MLCLPVYVIVLFYAVYQYRLLGPLVLQSIVMLSLSVIGILLLFRNCTAGHCERDGACCCHCRSLTFTALEAKPSRRREGGLHSDVEGVVEMVFDAAVARGQNDRMETTQTLKIGGRATVKTGAQRSQRWACAWGSREERAQRKRDGAWLDGAGW